MFCPNCGVPEQSPDSYCKKCGTYLRDVSFRRWLLGGNNPGRVAWYIAASSVFLAILCVCASLLIVRADRSGDTAYLKYAFALCWAVTGYLVGLSVTCFRLWRKLRRARSSSDGPASAADASGAIGQTGGERIGQLAEGGSSGEATTELLTPPPREYERRKQAR